MASCANRGDDLVSRPAPHPRPANDRRVFRAPHRRSANESLAGGPRTGDLPGHWGAGQAGHGQAALVRRFVDHRSGSRNGCRLAHTGLMKLRGTCRSAFGLGIIGWLFARMRPIGLRRLGQLGGGMRLCGCLCSLGLAALCGSRALIGVPGSRGTVICFSRPILGRHPQARPTGGFDGKTRPEGECAKGNYCDKQTCRFHIDSAVWTCGPVFSSRSKNNILSAGTATSSMTGPSNMPPTTTVASGRWT